MAKLIDAHCHLQFAAFDVDRKQTIERAFQAGVSMIVVGTDKESSQKAVELAQKYPEGIFAAVGQHPTETEKFESDFYAELAGDEKVVAIGECGLDYAVFVHEQSKRSQKRAPAEVSQPPDEGGLLFKKIEHAREIQKEIFIKHIEIANKVKKPLMIHCRVAFDDLIEILNSESSRLNSPPGIIHFFTGTIEDARNLLDLGFYFTFGGLITFNREFDGIIRFIPLERMLLETDAPFVAPAPYRGKRNEPAHALETAKKMAEIKNVSFEEIAGQTFENAEKVLRRPLPLSPQRDPLRSPKRMI